MTIFFEGDFSNFFLDKINFELTQRIVASCLFAFLQIRIEKRLCCLSSRYKNPKSLRVEFAFLQIRIEKGLCCLSSRYKNSKKQNFLSNRQIIATSHQRLTWQAPFDGFNCIGTYYDDEGIAPNGFDEQTGISVRCVKD